MERMPFELHSGPETIRYEIYIYIAIPEVSTCADVSRQYLHFLGEHGTTDLKSQNCAGFTKPGVRFIKTEEIRVTPWQNNICTTFHCTWPTPDSIASDGRIYKSNEPNGWYWVEDDPQLLEHWLELCSGIGFVFVSLNKSIQKELQSRTKLIAEDTSVFENMKHKLIFLDLGTAEIKHPYCLLIQTRATSNLDKY